ncbi:hypothetical protein Ccrd_022884, partial [Cynara cardunculus var. scolymus]
MVATDGSSTYRKADIFRCQKLSTICFPSVVYPPVFLGSPSPTSHHLTMKIAASSPGHEQPFVRSKLSFQVMDNGIAVG